MAIFSPHEMCLIMQKDRSQSFTQSDNKKAPVQTFSKFFHPNPAKISYLCLASKKFKKICFKNNLSKWAPSKQPSYIIPSMFTNNLIQVGPLQCPLNPIFPRGIFAISHAFAFRSQTTQLKCVPSGPKP